MVYTERAEQRARSAERRAKRKDNAAFIAATSHRILPSHGVLEEALDREFSLWIRARDRALKMGMCVICNRRPITDCFHWIPRGHHGVRWDPENAVGACHYCNEREQKKRGLFRHLFIIMYGEEKRLELESRAREHKHFDAAELAEKLDHFTRENRGECSR
jgi:hypothetical protein